MSSPAGRHGGSLRHGKTTLLGGDIKREPLPPAYQPMPSRWRIEYERCRTVQTDLAGSVDAGHKAFVVEGYRVGEASSAAIKGRPSVRQGSRSGAGIRLRSLRLLHAY